jgi:hypothetical protein
MNEFTINYYENRLFKLGKADFDTVLEAYPQ